MTCLHDGDPGGNATSVAAEGRSLRRTIPDSGATRLHPGYGSRTCAASVWPKKRAYGS